VCGTAVVKNSTTAALTAAAAATSNANRADTKHSKASAG
jgi:hypothetical protein